MRAWIRAFARVEEHPRAHLIGAAAFVAAVYLLLLTIIGAAAGALGATAVLLGVPLVGIVLPAVFRRVAIRRHSAGWRRVAHLLRSLFWGPLGFWAVSAIVVVASGATGAAGVLETLVNGAFIAAGLYPLLWVLVALFGLTSEAIKLFR